jgi:4-amino-4-deoxy-L-arabinose transferase-like glycosyltransferase
MIFELAGLLHTVNNRGFILATNILVLLASIGLWFFFRKPALFAVFQDEKHHQYFQISFFLKSIRENGALTVFALCLLAIYAYAAYLVVFFPQNVDDILTTYLARVGFWLQYGSFGVWKTSVYNLPQVSSPGNAQILILWTVLFNGTDLYAAFSQWTASLFAILAIYGLCRMLKQRQSLSIFLALLFATIPAVTLQLSTAQTDLMASAFFICSVYLLCLGWKEDHTGLLILAALSYAIGVGTKQTVIFAFPGLAIVLLILFLKFPLNRVWKIKILVGCTFLFTFLVGSFFYIQNALVFGRPFGPDEVAQTYTGLKEISPASQLGMGVKNFVSFTLNTLFSEFFDDKITPVLAEVVPQLSNYADYRGSVLPYSVGTIGPLISILSLIGIIATIKKHEKNPLSLALLISGVVYLVVIFVIRRYTNAIYRYSVMAFAMFLPLVGEADFWFRNPDRKLINQSFIRLISAFAILIMAWTITADGSKSLFDMIKEPGRTRTMKQMTFVKREQPDLEASYIAVEDLVPPDASLGLVGSGKYPVSPLFGKNFSRQITLIVPSDKLTVNMDEYPTVDYLLVDSSLMSHGLAVPAGYSAVSEDGLLHLYRKANK